MKFVPLYLLILLALLSACRNNPVGPKEHFLATPGPILFISDSTGTDQLYSMNADGNNVQQLTDDPDFPILDAKWSPDGRKIAVVSLVGDSLTYPYYRRVIFIMNADGSGRYQLTGQWFDTVDSTNGKVEYGGASGPVWSPNSKQIAYTRLMVPEALANMDFFVIKMDESSERRITRTTSLSEGVMDWSKGGNSLWGAMDGYPAMDSLGHSIQYVRLTLFNLEGKVLKSWGRPGEVWGWPILSNSGNNLAYNLDKDHHQDVYTMNVDGSKRSNITNGMCQYTRPVSWSPDDSQILLNCSYFNNENKLVSRILLINSDGTNPTDITPFNGKYLNLKATSWRR